MTKQPSTKMAHGEKMPSARKAGPGRYHQQGLKASKNRPTPKALTA